MAGRCEALANEVEEAVKKYAIVEHPEFGKVYAFEVDGYGSRVFMDDANVPSLLALPFLGCVDVNDPVYQNTRRLVLSPSNPYFFKGKAGEGIGGPHIGFNYIWPMSLIMRATTSNDEKEIRYCIETLRDTDGGTGFSEPVSLPAPTLSDREDPTDQRPCPDHSPHRKAARHGALHRRGRNTSRLCKHPLSFARRE